MGFRDAPKWFKPEARGKEDSSSNIAYVTLDMVHKQPFSAVQFQINAFRGKEIKAWFVDILHTPNQTPNALYAKELIDNLLREVSPKLKPVNRTVCLNAGGNPKFLRARDKMYEILRDHRAQNVVFRGPDDQQQPIEY